MIIIFKNKQIFFNKDLIILFKTKKTVVAKQLLGEIEILIKNMKLFIELNGLPGFSSI